MQSTLAGRRGELLLHLAPALLLDTGAAEPQQQLLLRLRPVPFQEAAQIAIRLLMPFAVRAQQLGGAVDFFLRRREPGVALADQDGGRHRRAGGSHAGRRRRQHRRLRDYQHRRQGAPGKQAERYSRHRYGRPAGVRGAQPAARLLQPVARAGHFCGRRIGGVGQLLQTGGRLRGGCRFGRLPIDLLETLQEPFRLAPFGFLQAAA